MRRLAAVVAVWYVAFGALSLAGAVAFFAWAVVESGGPHGRFALDTPAVLSFAGGVLAVGGALHLVGGLAWLRRWRAAAPCTMVLSILDALAWLSLPWLLRLGPLAGVAYAAAAAHVLFAIALARPRPTAAAPCDR